MTTDAVKKGDLVDLFIDMKKKGLIGEPSHIADYPETVIDTLKLLVKIFGLHDGAIPSKRSKGKYANWINGLNRLQEICPANMEECLTIALQKYEAIGKTFLIYQPQSIEKLLIDAVAEKNRLAQQQKEVEELHNKTFVDGKTISAEFSNLFED